MISIALSEKYPEKTLRDLHYFRATAEKMKKPNLPTDRDGKPRVLTVLREATEDSPKDVETARYLRAARPIRVSAFFRCLAQQSVRK